MSTSAESIRLPEQFGRYRIVRKLGEGGMGAVFLAHDENLKRDVALKVCKQVDNVRALERFRKEAEAAARLRHQHLCPVFDYGLHDNTAFIVMAYIPGQPLHKWLAEHPLNFRQSAELVQVLALAMQEAHEAGVIHRDLKPGNIVIDQRGDPIILDFGLARLAEARTQSSAGQISGTPAYMAPEQALGATEEIGAATDVYALGVMLYELLTGELPFVGPPLAVMAQVMHATPRAPRQHNPAIPPALEAVCLRAMAKQGRARYASMCELADALSTAVTALPAATSARPPRLRLPQETQWTDAARSSQRTAPPNRPATPDGTTILAPRSRGLAKWLLALLVAALVLGVLAAVRFGDRPQEPFRPPHQLVLELGDGAKLELLRIEPGHFNMGASRAEWDEIKKQLDVELKDQDEHPVEITKGFYLGKYTVTQEQYTRVTGKPNPSNFRKGGPGEDRLTDVKDRDTRRFPVETVSWDEANAFCDELMKHHADQIPTGLTEAGYRFGLPTEAQWELACRAGTTTVYHFGNQLNGTEANCDGNHPFGTQEKGPYLKRPQEVGRYPENRWGLHDMHGNVWQWCADYYDPDYYPTGPMKDPFCSNKPADAERRVLRGGSWYGLARYCRAADRYAREPSYGDNNIGFRICLRLE